MRAFTFWRYGDSSLWLLAWLDFTTRAQMNEMKTFAKKKHLYRGEWKHLMGKHDSIKCSQKSCRRFQFVCVEDASEVLHANIIQATDLAMRGIILFHMQSHIIKQFILFGTCETYSVQNVHLICRLFYGKFYTIRILRSFHCIGVICTQ